MTQQQKLRLNFVALLVVCAAVVVLAIRAEDRVFQNNGRLSVSLQDDDTVVLTWKSPVDAPMARRFEEAYNEWKHDARRFVIDLHSPGGSLREGEAVIRVIERMKQSHPVDTRVGRRRSCLSMCVPIFLQGDNRVAAANSRWMFHQPTARDVFTGEEVDEPAFERRYASRRFVRRYFEQSPMDPRWLDALLKDWEDGDVWKTGQVLYEENAGVITELY